MQPKDALIIVLQYLQGRVVLFSLNRRLCYRFFFGGKERNVLIGILNEDDFLIGFIDEFAPKMLSVE